MKKSKKKKMLILHKGLKKNIYLVVGKNLMFNPNNGIEKKFQKFWIQKFSIVFDRQ